MSFDANNLINGLKRYDADMRRRALAAVDEFAEHVKSQAVDYSPFATGNLATSATTTPATEENGIISAEVGFNTPYAAAVHEKVNQIINTRRNPRARRKYLETALNEEGPKFMPFVASRLKEGA